MADSNAHIARRAAPVGTVAGMLPEMLEDAHLVPLPRPPPNSCSQHSAPPRGRTLTAAYDRKGHAPGSAPGAVACVGGAIALGARRRAGDAERPRAAPSAPRPERRGRGDGGRDRLRRHGGPLLDGHARRLRVLHGGGERRSD